MDMLLNNFDEYIDDTILRRGLAYFRNGKVDVPEELRPGVYSAIVYGSQAYSVRVTVADGIITEHVCSCPYDTGPVCKHVAAVLYYLQQDAPGLQQKSLRSGSVAARKPKKRQTVAERVDGVLHHVDFDDLKQFVREQANLNIEFRNLLFASFASQGSGESKGFYQKQLKSILRSAKDRNGFIGWSASNRVAEGVNQFLKLAKQQRDARNDKGCIVISAAVMEQMVDALQYADDSDGSIGGIINAAYELLYSIAESQPEENIRKQLFDYCFKAVEKKIYAGWDWHTGMLRIAAMLGNTPEEIKRVFSELDNENGTGYSMQEAQRITYGLIARVKGENAAGAYLEANQDNPELRRIAIQKALTMGDYQRAILIAKDGVTYDRQERPGLVIEWYDWLLKIALLQDNREHIMQYARILFIENFSQEQDYYSILKQYVAPEMWVGYVNDLIKEIAEKNRRWNAEEQIAGICILEGWMDMLLQVVSESESLHTIAKYEPNLAKDYASELVGLYSRGVREYLQHHVGRNHYQYACRFLRRMIKLGGRAAADELVSFLRTAYPHRKALIDELNKV